MKLNLFEERNSKLLHCDRKWRSIFAIIRGKILKLYGNATHLQVIKRKTIITFSWSAHKTINKHHIELRKKMLQSFEAFDNIAPLCPKIEVYHSQKLEDLG